MDIAQDSALTLPYTKTEWDSVKIDWNSGTWTVSSYSSLDFWTWRGFDSLHPLHYSTLHSERVTAAMESWGFWFSQRIQWASSEIWRSYSVLLYQLMDLLLLPLSKTIHLIGLLRSQQSPSFINVDVALTLSLNVIITHRFAREYWFECTLKWFDLNI